MRQRDRHSKQPEQAAGGANARGGSASVLARPRGAICKKPAARSIPPRTIGRGADSPASTAATLSNGDVSMQTVDPIKAGGQTVDRSADGAHGGTAVVQPKREELRELFGLGQGKAALHWLLLRDCHFFVLLLPVLLLLGLFHDLGG
jgi:hypothetical protein